MAKKIFTSQTGSGGPVNPVQTADNGLSQNVETNVQLGGTLIGDTTITPNAHTLNLGLLAITDADVTYTGSSASPTEIVTFGTLPAPPTIPVTGVNNGLTLNSNTAQLGGTLINANTDIDVGANQIAIRDTGSNTSLSVGAGGISMNVNNGQIDVTHDQAQMFVATGGFRIIQINTSGMVVTDNAQGIGLQNGADYSGNTNPLRLVQLNEIGSKTVASNKVAGVMASGNLITYPITATSPSMFRLDIGLVFRSGTGTAAVTATFTDTGGNVNTQTLATLAAAGGAFADVVTIYANNATNISIDAVITGTAIADIASAIEFII